MAERGRQAMVSQFKAFYREENARILELKIGRDYYRLHNLFASWIQRRSDMDTPEMDSKTRNVLIAKTLRDWDAWVVIVDKASEEMVFETFHVPRSPTIPTLSPTGESYQEGG